SKLIDPSRDRSGRSPRRTQDDISQKSYLAQNARFLKKKQGHLPVGEMSFVLVYEYGFLGEDFDAVCGDLVWSRLHVDRGLSHLLYLENPVVCLADLSVGHYDDTVSKVFLELDGSLNSGTHRP